jgi:hypothetical protein
MDEFWAHREHPLYGRTQRDGVNTYRIGVLVVMTSAGRRRIFTQARQECLLTALRWSAREEGLSLFKVAICTSSA